MYDITLNKVIKEKNRISFEIDFSPIVIDYTHCNTMTLQYIYDVNIEDVPEQILNIPFVANFLPLIFVLDATLYLNVGDKNFLKSIQEIREGYQKMIPSIKMGGRIFCDKEIETIYKTGTNCLLFSGGIDAMNSLAINHSSISDLISIWGSDIEFNNKFGRDNTIRSINDIALKFGKKVHIIHSNFREFLNEEKLCKLVSSSGDNWRHGFQHGIALIGQVAPLAYLFGYKHVLIASSFTKEFNPICASNPLIDNAFKYSQTDTIHDGFEFDRCDKINNIFNYLEKNNQTVKLHVCWESQSGQNCGHCEKCIRSYLNCLAVNKDPSLLGLNATINMKKIRRIYLKKTYYDDQALDRFRVLKKHIIKTYKVVPDNLKRIVDTNFENLNNRLYWKVRHFAGKTKRRIIKCFKKVRIKK